MMPMQRAAWAGDPEAVLVSSRPDSALSGGPSPTMPTRKETTSGARIAVDASPFRSSGAEEAPDSGLVGSVTSQASDSVVGSAMINIVLFWFHDDWGRYGRTYEKIAANLAKLPEVNHVVCVFPPKIVERFDVVGLHERWITRKLTLLTEQVRVHGSRVGRLIQRAQRWRALRAYLHRCDFTAQNTILWLYPPHPYLDRLRQIVPHRLIVTHVVDNFAQLEPSCRLYGEAVKQYPRIGDWSDLIFTNSEANHVEFSAMGVPCARFAQGLDESFLATASDLPHRVTGDRPRLGYLGFIMHRTDLTLLASVAAQRPDWDVILAGPDSPHGYLSESGFLRMKNIRWVGEIPYQDVPTFLQSFDVCLIPHRDTSYARSMSPLKLYQYLGSGRPVVSTPVDGLERFDDHVHVARDAAGFTSAIQECLDRDSIAQSKARIDAVRNETWNNRAREMLHVALDIEGAMKKKPFGDLLLPRP